MTNKIGISGPQRISLVALRILIGWHCLYEGIVKLLNPYWSSAPFLLESKGWLSNWFISLAADGGKLHIIDLMNIWGLILIGLGLIVGIYTRWAAAAGALLLVLYYLANPPLPAIASTLPLEGSYLLVNKTLIEAAALIVIAFFPTGEWLGLEPIVRKRILKKKSGESR